MDELSELVGISQNDGITVRSKSSRWAGQAARTVEKINVHVFCVEITQCLK